MIFLNLNYYKLNTVFLDTLIILKYLILLFSEIIIKQIER